MQSFQKATVSVNNNKDTVITYNFTKPEFVNLLIAIEKGKRDKELLYNVELSLKDYKHLVKVDSLIIVNKTSIIKDKDLIIDNKDSEIKYQGIQLKKKEGTIKLLSGVIGLLTILCLIK